MKHTKGPWKVAPLESDPYENIRVVAENNRGVCELWQDDAPVPDYNATQHANARLIAAAPEMLEALIKVMSWVDNWSPEFTEEDEWAEDEIAARAAIAKATQ